MDVILKRGYNVAKKCLNRCYTQHGIISGTTHYSNYWARDGLFSTFGACALGDFDVVRSEIRLFLSRQRSDGMLPMRVGQKNMLPGFFGLRMSDKPAVYNEDKSGHVPMDQNSLAVISAANYARMSGDIGFVREVFPKLEKAMSWYRPRHHLLEEKPFSAWTDSVKKQGNVLYTNVLFCRALYDMHALSSLLGKESDFLERHEKTMHAIDANFWGGRSYYDWIDEKKETYFSVPENTLAILLGVASRARAKLIVSEAEKTEAGFTVWNVRPRYMKKHRSSFLDAVGMGDYHDGVLWLWPGCLYALARHRLGMDPIPMMKAIAMKMAEYGTVYEIYNPDGTPVRRPLYKAERDFAWSSSIFIYSLKEILGVIR